MDNAPAMKPITEYLDYRRFLADYYEYQKRRFRGFSYRYFARKAGINSSSFLKRVIDGERNLTRPAIEKFITALALSEKQSIYFRNLVLFNQAKTAAEKQEAYAVLRTLRGIVKEKILQTDEHDYFHKWYTPIIRELICIHDFCDDFSELAQAVWPPISTKEARDAVKLLLRLNLVEKQDDGPYRQTDELLTADQQVLSLGVREYVRAMIAHCGKAIDAFDKSERHISTMSLAVNRATYEAMVQELEAFKDRMKALIVQEEHAEQVYELNIGLFPASRHYGRPRRKDT
jgi:uncharacterized protein (TIGR02147 family)